MDANVLAEMLGQWAVPAISAAIALTIVTIAYRIGMAVLRRVTRYRPTAAVFVERAASPGLAVAALLAL
jgi:hypothetical protein